MKVAGFIKLHRKSRHSTVFAHDGLWKLFCLCLMKAAWEEKTVGIPGINNPVKLMPGQFVTGRNSLHFDYHQGQNNPRYSRKLSPSPLNIYRWLKKLEKMEILNINSCNKYSIIIVCNWTKYQNHEHQVEHQDEQQNEHKEECIKKGKRISVDSEVLYSFYLQKINPKEKTKKRALLNISSHLKKYSLRDLKSAVLNYKTVSSSREPQYRKNPANFFGKNEKPFLDYLPENYEGDTSSKRETTGSPLLDSYYAANSD